MLEKKVKGRGIKEVNTNVFEGNPDLMIQVDGAKAERLGLKPDAIARQLKAIFLGQIAAQVQESSARLTDVRVRYPDALRFGAGRFDTGRILNQWIMLPAAAPAPGPTPPDPAGPARTVLLSAVADVKPIPTPRPQIRQNQLPASVVPAPPNEGGAGPGSA